MFLRISKSFQNPNYPGQKSPVRGKQITQRKLTTLCMVRVLANSFKKYTSGISLFEVDSRSDCYTLDPTPS